ncbi:GNAT family N-acetyltransferase [Luethyella okanaganae]|uniref:GNAT family N-acetyltransferase n=1 Tax=Luethyella okanaganae TaxID=69372 RepID=A0ABW1VFN0_9MICO
MTAVRPELAPIAGRFIRLEPLTVEFLPELHAAIGHPLVFAGGYGGGPAGYRAEVGEFVTWAKGYLQLGAGNVYGVRLLGGPHDGELVGTSTLGDIDLARASAHIGWTAYDPRVWGSAVNAEAKLLLLSLAFDHGFGRIKIQADAANARSRSAIERLGAVYEGTIRRERPRADGSWRDTAVYSILAEEWPGVRAGLLERLERYTEPVAYRAAAEPLSA